MPHAIPTDTAPGVPPDAEQARLDALHSLDILDTPPERDFDDLVGLAAAACGTPVGLVSLVDRDRQWFKAKVGVDFDQASGGPSFCRHAIDQADRSRVFEVADASADPRFAASPLVAGDFHLRFYAGVPLVMADGTAIGTLCVVDRRPRELTADQRAALRTVARVALSRLELRDENRRLQRENAALAEGKLNLLLESTDDGIYGVDADGRCTFVNRAAAQMLGYARDELLGRNLHDLLHHHRADGSGLPARECPISQTRLDGRPCRVDDEVFFRRDGSSFPVEYAGHPGRGGRADDPTETVVTFRDITSRKAA